MKNKLNSVIQLSTGLFFVAAWGSLLFLFFLISALTFSFKAVEQTQKDLKKLLTKIKSTR